MTMMTTMIELIVNRKPKRPKFYARCSVDGELFTGYGENEWIALSEATRKALDRMKEPRSSCEVPKRLTLFSD